MASLTLPKNSSPTARSGFPPGLLALAIGGFGIGLTEFVISGLLTDVATSLKVSVPAAGALIWVYALAVVVGAFTVTAALSRRPPKTALLVLLIFFIIGNVVTAAAPTFEVAIVGRIVTAMCHGGYFGIGAVLAAELVPTERAASAMAVMFGGLTAANVLGVPFGTFVGQHLGWRATFWIVAAIGILALISVATLVPTRLAPDTAGTQQFSVLLRPQVLVSVVLTMLLFGGVFGAFIYVEPLVTHLTGFSQAAVPWLLVAFGVGLFLGNIAGGRFADRDLGRALRGLSVLLTIVLAIYALTARSQVGVPVLLFLMGFIGFATTPALQLRVVRFASDAPTMASAANIAAFNLGNAIATFLGGLAIAAGLGWTSPIWIGTAMTGLAAILTFVVTHEEAS